MSGKEPPKGPRALRTPAPFAAGASYQNHNQIYHQPTASSSRGGLGVAPPTGPRSLVNVNGSAGGRHLPPAPAVPKVHVNGFGGRAPPSGPKGKGHANSVSPTNTSTTWAYGKPPPSGPSALMSSQRMPNGTGVGMSMAPRAPISISFPPPQQPKQPPPPSPPHSPLDRSSRRPPSPASPPPPPPRSPPPPPPAEVPHNRSPISIKFPSSQPHQPRLAPPPLPPSPSEPPEPTAPQPPSSAPPPLPPTDPRRLPAVPARPPPSYRRSPSPPREASGSRLPPPPTPRAPSPERPPTPLPDGVTVTYKRVPGHQHPQKLYSLNTPPMPDRSTYRNPSDRDYRVLFDSGYDKDRTGEMKLLIDTVHSAGAEDRIDKGKGKPILYRYEGETVKGEKEARARDPRKEPGFRAGKYRTEFYTTSYEYDSNSIGPEPPTNILIFGFPELTQSAKIRQHFQKYGTIVSFERELDRATGGQMGVASITYSMHAEAKRAVEGEEGKNFTLAAFGGGPIVSFANAKGPGTEKDSVKVVFDGEGKLLKLVIGLYEERRRREKERERGRLAPQVGESGPSGTPTLNGQVATPIPSQPNPMQRRPFVGPHPPDQHPHPNHRPLAHAPGPYHLPHKPVAHVAPNVPPRVGPSNFARGPGFQHHADRFSMNQNARRYPPPSLVRARAMNAARSSVPQNMPPNLHNLQTPDTDSRSATPVHALRGRGGVRGLVPGLAHQHSHSRTPTYTSTSTPRGSRSPSPALSTRRPDAKPSHEEKEVKHHAVVQALVRNGYDHARIDEKQLSGRAAREEDVREFFKGFPVDEVLHDHTGWYITFQKPDAAGRAARVLAIGTHTLANRSVSISVHSTPLPGDVKSLSPTSLAKGVDAKRKWKPDEMVEEASKTVKAELLALLEKDVMERIVGAHIRKVISESKGRKEKDSVAGKTEVRPEKADGERERRRLQGLSFKKRKQKTEAVARPEPDQDKEAVAAAQDADEVSLVVTRADEGPLVAVTLTEDETDLVQPADKEVEKEERPRKRRKAETRVVRDEDIESEDGVEVEESKNEDVAPVHVEDVPIPEPEPPAASPVQRKRSLSPTPVDEPPAKRTKVSEEPAASEEVEVEIAPPSPVISTPVKSKKPSTKKAEKEKEKKTTKRPKKAKAERGVLEALVIPPQIEVEAPAVTEVHVSPSPTWASVPVPAPPPSAITERPPSPKRYSPLPESVLHEIVEDDEDLLLSKLALSLDGANGGFSLQEEKAATSDPNAPPPFRKHVTGSARSEGYYKISHTEKSAYVAQYALRGAVPEGPAEKEVPAPKQPIVSSRSNRANARRRAQGLEEMNQLQLAVALSKGENAATEVMKFNQLQTRKKHLRFARSPIHDWGLYAMERISRGEMVIEYVGEIIRAAVADKREKAYERQGIGSSYLFRIDEDLVVDATKKGNLGRLINHSCDPNCTAKIITINGEKKIVIYAKQDIELGDEITYDYHFPIEQDKIPCLCGSAKCRGFLN